MKKRITSIILVMLLLLSTVFVPGRVSKAELEEIISDVPIGETVTGTYRPNMKYKRNDKIYYSFKTTDENAVYTISAKGGRLYFKVIDQDALTVANGSIHGDASKSKSKKLYRYSTDKEYKLKKNTTYYVSIFGDYTVDDFYESVWNEESDCYDIVSREPSSDYAFNITKTVVKPKKNPYKIKKKSVTIKRNPSNTHNSDAYYGVPYINLSKGLKTAVDYKIKSMPKGAKKKFACYNDGYIVFDWNAPIGTYKFMVKARPSLYYKEGKWLKLTVRVIRGR